MYFGSWRIVSEGSITTSLLIAHSMSFQHIANLPFLYFYKTPPFNDVLFNLGFRLFKSRTISTPKRSKPSSRTFLIGEQPNPWDLLQPQDKVSRHRGAEHRRRYGLSGGTSLLSPG